MPALEMAQETGKLIAWRKKEGDRVTKGEPLLEIETDKAVVEVEAPADGILAGIKASEGSDIPVGQTIAWIVAPGEKPPVETESAAPAARAGSHPNPEASHVAVAHAGSSAQASAPSAKISPKARRLAKEFGSASCALRPSKRLSRGDEQDALHALPAAHTREAGRHQVLIIDAGRRIDQMHRRDVAFAAARPPPRRPGCRPPVHALRSHARPVRPPPRRAPRRGCP